MAHPTTMRENRSRTTARYNHPSAVGIAVISVTHLVLGRGAVKSRLRRFGAKRAVGSLLLWWVYAFDAAWLVAPELASAAPPACVHNASRILARPREYVDSHKPGDSPGQSFGFRQKPCHLLPRLSSLPLPATHTTPPPNTPQPT